MGTGLKEPTGIFLLMQSVYEKNTPTYKTKYIAVYTGLFYVCYSNDYMV